MTRARALIGVAEMAGDVGDEESSKRAAEEALRICRAIGDTWGEAFSLLNLGFPFAERDEWPEAKQRFEKSMQLFLDIDDQHWALAAARRLAWVLEELGDLEHSRALREDNLRQARAIGDRHTEAQSLAWLGEYVP